MLKTTLNKLLFPAIGYISCSNIQSNCATDHVNSSTDHVNSSTDHANEPNKVVIKKSFVSIGKFGQYESYIECTCDISFKYPTNAKNAKNAKNMNVLENRIESLALEKIEYYDWKSCRECTEYKDCYDKTCQCLCTSYKCNVYEEDIKDCIENAIPNCTIENIKFICNHDFGF